LAYIQPEDEYRADELGSKAHLRNLEQTFIPYDQPDLSVEKDHGILAFDPQEIRMIVRKRKQNLADEDGSKDQS